jgi:GTP-binding protein EngB required for normal cell division
VSQVNVHAPRAQTVSAEALAAQASALTMALDAGGDHLDPGGIAQARRLVEKVVARTSIAGSHTVAALAGATGSGKSSILNALVGSEVAEIGARRPTTAWPTAAVWGPESATELLDWLGVQTRHVVDAASDADTDLERLVLLDLPDFDSRVQSHRIEAQRILELVDVFVWVTDPQKYADALLHDEYLRRLAGHETVTLVVLNQSDRLTGEAARECTEDLRRLLAADGMEHADVHLTSAANGDGIPGLRARLAAAVASQDAARRRLSADILDCATSLRAGVADHEPEISGAADAALVDALARTAGVPLVLQAVADDYRREAGSSGGWVFTRWMRAFRPDPLARLRLDRSSVPLDSEARDSVRAVLGRSSIPPPSPSAQAAVSLATRRLTERATAGMPARWADAIEDAAATDAGLADALDQAVVHTPLREDRPAWWQVMGALQWVFGLATVVGAVWLGVLAVVGWLQLPAIPTPTVGVLPVPTLLLAAGLGLGALFALVTRWLAGIGARRRRAVVERRLRAAVTEVAHERIVDPVSAVLDRHRVTREALDAARGGAGPDAA